MTRALYVLLLPLMLLVVLPAQAERLVSTVSRDEVAIERFPSYHHVTSDTRLTYITAGEYLRREQMRTMVAVLVLAVAVRFGPTLVLPPMGLYSMAVAASGALQ